MAPAQPLTAPLFTILPHTVLQSFARDYDVPEELRWRPGHFSAHLTGMPLDRRLRMLEQVLAAEAERPTDAELAAAQQEDACRALQGMEIAS